MEQACLSSGGHQEVCQSNKGSHMQQHRGPVQIFSEKGAALNVKGIAALCGPTVCYISRSPTGELESQQPSQKCGHKPVSYRWISHL